MARLDPCGIGVAESRIASAINQSKGLLRGFENYSYNSKHNDYIYAHLKARLYEYMKNRKKEFE